jgi:hypothetical protein
MTGESCSREGLPGKPAGSALSLESTDGEPVGSVDGRGLESFRPIDLSTFL